MLPGLSLRLVSVSLRHSVALASLTLFESKEECERQWQEVCITLNVEDAVFQWGEQGYYFVVDCTCPTLEVVKTEKVISKDMAVHISNTSLHRLMGMAMQSLNACNPAAFVDILEGGVKQG
ncbi:hypothetical protein J3998_06055 [Thiomicrorhabdus sp. 6S2-11]|uniref:Uncharacterized protein n=1 Tax=Thiomicrorhabdus marina TaxID=2818442 RepID=A0ABS3Q472_9GAMM|nr:hypothetical protein [Thiomicrorhabdus marina]MBO1927135.1 hypothetical protein [Thiomicrorhabdus marina]